MLMATDHQTIAVPSRRVRRSMASNEVFWMRENSEQQQEVMMQSSSAVITQIELVSSASANHVGAPPSSHEGGSSAIALRSEIGTAIVRPARTAKISPRAKMSCEILLRLCSLEVAIGSKTAHAMHANTLGGQREQIIVVYVTR